MKIVKYVIKKNEDPILFCPKVSHSDVVNTGISAGYVIIYYEFVSDKFIVKCFGSSGSLKLSIRVEDCNIIQDYLNNLLCDYKNNSINELKLFDKIIPIN